MTADPAALDRAVAMFAGMVQVVDPAIEDKRRGYDRMLAALPAPEGTAVESTRLGGVHCLRVTAAGVAPSAAAVLLHGGGYVMGSAAGYRGFAAAVSAAAGVEVVVPDYRLAPEHPYPAALDDARAVHEAVVAERGASRTGLVGDSAGGGLAAGLLLALRDEERPQPACAVLVSPELDLTASTDSVERNRERDPVVRREGILGNGGLYLNGRDPRETPYASPHWGSPHDLPPLLVLTGDIEAMHDEAVDLTERVAAAGGRAELATYPGMIHVWPLFWPFLPEARDAVGRIGAFLSRHLAEG
ncbi:alpha/beta hydrolase [Pseudonocardia halophobica]|uniref:Hydrolase n=1 Tax=Pseudonocardia halophobica TaxID=29401 RepID=A0A9W6KXB3_9PSEU|nr:alpha/beta hydrolase [Pseudonocardia halophobica]GLL09767.1 hydrolase [Pseudonocardia halophobica]